MHNFSRSSEIFTDLQKCLSWYHRRKPRMIAMANNLSVLDQWNELYFIY